MEKKDKKGDLIDKNLYVFLINTLEDHGLSTGEAVTLMKGHKDTEVYEICKEYIREELLESAALIASHLLGEHVDMMVLDIQKKAKSGTKVKTGCKFNDILG